MYGVQVKAEKRAKDLMLMLSLNETKGQLAMANTMQWNDHVPRI